VVGYLLRKRGVPMAPLILGFVLGDMMEQNLRRALSITNGELGILVGSPICIGLWVGCGHGLGAAGDAGPAQVCQRLIAIDDAVITASRPKPRQCLAPAFF
jgi:hypothetical protein